jgi:hypothetical protein
LQSWTVWFAEAQAKINDANTYCPKPKQSLSIIYHSILKPFELNKHCLTDEMLFYVHDSQMELVSWLMLLWKVGQDLLKPKPKFTEQLCLFLYHCLSSIIAFCISKPYEPHLRTRISLVGVQNFLTAITPGL